MDGKKTRRRPVRRRPRSERPSGEAGAFKDPRGPHIAAILRRVLQFVDRSDLTDERAKTFHAIIDVSFAAEQSVACLPDQEWLCRMTGLGKTVVSRAVGDMEALGMLEHWQRKKDAGTHRDRRHGGMLYRIDPDWNNWDVEWRVDAFERKQAIDAWAWAYRINLHPDAPSLALPSDWPGLAEALWGLARDAALAHPLAADFPPQSRDTGRAPRDASTPDNKPWLCRQPTTGNQPAAGVREADAPAAEFPTSVHTSGAIPPDTSVTFAGDLRVAEDPRLAPTPENIAAGLADFRRRLARAPGESVSPRANLPGPESATELAHELTHLAGAPVTRASDVPEHLYLRYPVNEVAILPSDVHPDVPDECSLHKAQPDVCVPDPEPGVYTGDLHADLRRTMGAGSYAAFRGAWESYVACDRETVIVTLGEYRIALTDPRRRDEVKNAGAWMGRVFRNISRKWKGRR